jgi:prevent-host-death family protein
MWLECLCQKCDIGGGMSVGVRELRDGLSRHLAEVRSGRTITVTDHGRPIARIVPVGRPTRLEQLVAEGKVRPAHRSKQPAPRPLAAEGTVSDLVADQRR